MAWPQFGNGDEACLYVYVGGRFGFMGSNLIQGLAAHACLIGVFDYERRIALCATQGLDMGQGK